MRMTVPRSIRSVTPMSWFAILSVITVALALGLPPDPASVHQLHTTNVAFRLAVAALLVPYLVIWYTGFYALAKLREYSRTLSGHDGAGFRKITMGMGVLAFSLVIPTAIAQVLASIATRHTGFKPTVTIIDNYMSLFGPLVAFLFINSGTRLLVRSGNWAHKAELRWHAAWFVLLSVYFTYFTLHNQHSYQVYHLSFPVLLTTLTAPYLYAWLMGLLSAYELRLYARHVPGTIYRQGIQLLSRGIALTVAAWIAIQFVAVTITPRFRNSLGAVLLIDYLLIILLAAGLLFIAFGTKRLKKIEEV